MVVRYSDDDIWYWHQVIEKYQASGLSQQKFCDEHGIDYSKFCSKFYRMVYKKHRDPELYKKLVVLTREFMESGMRNGEFAKLHGISPQHLSEMTTHLQYQDRIKSIRLIKEKSSMRFIEVPTINLPMPTPQEPEVLKKQNDVELIISAGVKVVVAPEVEADKLIRIIELLKDL